MCRTEYAILPRRTLAGFLLNQGPTQTSITKSFVTLRSSFLLCIFLRRQFAFNRVVIINLVDGFVDLPASVEIIFQESVRAFSHDFFDLAEAELSAKPSSDARRQFRTPLRQISDDMQRRIYAIDRKAYGMREI